jgi:hypothetical protein
MATGETGFDDVAFDLISVQYHSLKAGHDYGQYVRDAVNAGRDDVASFFEDVMSQDADRAARCHGPGGRSPTTRAGGDGVARARRRPRAAAWRVRRRARRW